MRASGPSGPRQRGVAGATVRVRIEKLAPTGEGIARTEGGVGFIDRTLPGELVETSIYERRRRFWRGHAVEVLEPSPDREGGAHAACAGCDWGHFALDAARRAKGELFLETMERIGRLSPALFGGPIEWMPSEKGYRLRTRLHVAGRGAEARVGYFAPRTHDVVPAAACESIPEGTRRLFAGVRDAIAEGGPALSVSETAVLEDLDGERRLVRVSTDAPPPEVAALAERLAPLGDGARVRSLEGGIRLERGARRLEYEIGGRRLRVSVDTFFQGNRFLVGPLASDVASHARRIGPGEALDAFGGAGLFGGALLSAGHRVVSVELDPEAVADARATREADPDGDRWAIEAASVADYLRADDRRFDVVVVDPPRAGLGTVLAGELAARTRALLLYVSCDPATLARDLAALSAGGLRIRSARLYDLFAFTHRVEALVALERPA